MGSLGRKIYKRRNGQKYWDFEMKKQIFLVKSPYLQYTKQKYDEFAQVSTPKGNFPPILTPITKSKKSFERVLSRSIDVNVPDIMPIKEEFHHNIVNLFIYNISMKQHAESEFNGFRLSREKLSSIPKKRHSLITFNNVFTSLDGFQVRIFIKSTTRMKSCQLRRTSYASSSQIKRIRKVMSQVMKKHMSKMKILDFVERMAIKCEMSSEIRQKCENIYPLADVLIVKMKVLEKPSREEY